MVVDPIIDPEKPGKCLKNPQTVDLENVSVRLTEGGGKLRGWVDVQTQSCLDFALVSSFFVFLEAFMY